MSAPSGMVPLIQDNLLSAACRARGRVPLLNAVAHDLDHIWLSWRRSFNTGERLAVSGAADGFARKVAPPVGQIGGNAAFIPPEAGRIRTQARRQGHGHITAAIHSPTGDARVRAVRPVSDDIQAHALRKPVQGPRRLQGVAFAGGIGIRGTATDGSGSTVGASLLQLMPRGDAGSLPPLRARA